MSEPRIGLLSRDYDGTGDMLVDPYKKLWPDVVGVQFIVPGPPQPKQRARRGKGGRWYTPEATRRFESTVKEYAMQAFSRRREVWPTDAKYKLSVACFFPNGRHVDCDNVVKAVSDALNKLAYDDDSQVVAIAAEKHVDRQTPRTEVTLLAVDEMGQWPVFNAAWSR